ncbi:Protein of unknown function [Pyronema omphalodes CBS 100304]|uniref:Uncharacterized protein n=1 Tax=Pyronema omphalodes (strain CBS 100304) TaxID=1076935 RepID=U4L6N3_PYROM|nr:Protein of unknown function [Pyronema omphalodes CBS 100304]
MLMISGAIVEAHSYPFSSMCHGILGLDELATNTSLLTNFLIAPTRPTQ